MALKYEETLSMLVIFKYSKHLKINLRRATKRKYGATMINYHWIQIYFPVNGVIDHTNFFLESFKYIWRGKYLEIFFCQPECVWWWKICLMIWAHYCIMSHNGHTHFKSLAAFADHFGTLCIKELMFA